MLVSVTLLTPLTRLLSRALWSCTRRRENAVTGMSRPCPQGYCRLLEFKEWGPGRRVLESHAETSNNAHPDPK